MALMPLYDSADDVPESLRDHYEATDDGRMMLAVDSKDGVALENVTGLKTGNIFQRDSVLGVHC